MSNEVDLSELQAQVANPRIWNTPEWFAALAELQRRQPKPISKGRQRRSKR